MEKEKLISREIYRHVHVPSLPSYVLSHSLPSVRSSVLSVRTEVSICLLPTLSLAAYSPTISLPSFLPPSRSLFLFAVYCYLFFHSLICSLPPYLSACLLPSFIPHHIAFIRLLAFSSLGSSISLFLYPAMSSSAEEARIPVSFFRLICQAIDGHDVCCIYFTASNKSFSFSISLPHFLS